MRTAILCLIVLLVQAVFSFGCWNGRAQNNAKASEKIEAFASPSPSPRTDPTPSNSNVMNSNLSEPRPGGFAANLPSGFVQPTDDIGRRLLKEYGSVFMARGSATPPHTVIFKDEAEVSAFQSGIAKSSETIDGKTIELQSAAMKALTSAIQEAGQNRLTITPRDYDAGRRSYTDTVTLWASRVEPALDHWVGKGRMTDSDAQRMRGLSPFDQVPEIFKLESQGIYFAKDLSKSIIYSVAPPGTSQHLSMLAFDINEHENSRVREILAKHGWYQTVVSDEPHFTFLGIEEDQLKAFGLKKVSNGGRRFWLPAI
jgi:hypothetical protein